MGAGFGWTPSAIPGSVVGILQITQWTQGWGVGASGSSTISASSRAPGGRPDHSRGGERSSPSPVCRLGTTASGPNASLFRIAGMIVLRNRLATNGQIIEGALRSIVGECSLHCKRSTMRPVTPWTPGPRIWEVLTAHLRAAKVGASFVPQAIRPRWKVRFSAAHRTTRWGQVVVEQES